MREDRAKRWEKAGVRKKRLDRAVVKRFRHWLGRFLLIAMALLVLVWFGKQAYVFCANRAIRTETAQWSELVSTHEGQAIIMRNETVVTAPVAGSVAWLAADGDMVHTCSVVARISSTTGPEGGQGPVELKSPVVGIVSCRLDGWEGILDPAHYQRMDLFALFNSVRPKPPEAPLQDFQSGDPLFKIVDNLTDPYFVIKLDQQPEDMVVGSSVDMTWNAGGSGSGKVIWMQSKSGACIVIINVSQATEDVYGARTLDVKLIREKCEGIVVPAQALINQDGEWGVYTKTPIGIKFVEVEVAGTLGGKVALLGPEIQPGMDIVVNPGLVKSIDQGI